MMSDTIPESKVVDTYKEHAKHTVRRFANCSECYKLKKEHTASFKNRQHTAYNGINSGITLASLEESFIRNTNPFD